MVDYDRSLHVTNDGAWCWFQDPRALRHVGAHDRTYVGWITRYGDVEIQIHDHDTGETARTTLHADFEEDDHDAPSILVDSDGRLVVFYTEHGGPDIRYRISDEPEDITSFGEEDVIAPSSEHTYPNPYRLTAEGNRIYLFYRNERRNLAFVTSDDECKTWTEERELIRTEGWSGVKDGWVYFKIDSNGMDRIDVAVSHYDWALAPSPYRDVRHVQITDGAVATASGEKLASLDDTPLSFKECPLIYDSSETSYFSWIWDCATFDDKPAVAYAELRPDDEHRYRYARWSGEEWIDTDVVDGGHNIRPERVGAYSGGVYLDHEEPGVCYVSVGDYDGSRLERWQTTDNGRSWGVTALTDDRVQNVRPVVPRNRHQDLPVLWMRGNYDYFADQEYDTGIVAPRGRFGPEPSTD